MALKRTATSEQSRRLEEILFYNFFAQKEYETVSSPAFWNVVYSICDVYGIEKSCITKLARLVLSGTVAPSDLETYWLLTHVAKMSVRDINTTCGIYYQKQMKLQEELLKHTSPPPLTLFVKDPKDRQAMVQFIHALYVLFETPVAGFPLRVYNSVIGK